MKIFHGLHFTILLSTTTSNVESLTTRTAFEPCGLRHRSVRSVHRSSWLARPSATLPASVTRLLHATSSRDLQEKKNGPRKNNQSSSPTSKDNDETGVVQRLSKAIAQARANKLAQSTTKNDGSNAQQKSPSNAASSKSPQLGSLRQLNKEIDHQLAAARGPRRDQLIAGLAGAPVVLQPRDSMSALLEHNDMMNTRNIIPGPASASTVAMAWPTRHVAVVFSKPLVDNQVTLEYASRLRAVAKAIQEDRYRPSLLCFTGGISPPNVVADADAGFLFFQHLCATQRIPLNNVEFVLDRTSSLSGAAGVSDYQSKDEGKALTHIIQQIQQNWLSRWLDEEFTVDEDTTEANVSEMESETENTTNNKRPPMVRPKKLMVHFTLISTEYHLCNLNDIHHRSPRQSLLRPLATALSGEHRHPASGSIIQVEIIWSYRYSTYPSIYFARDEAKAFMGKCYRLGEELVPLLVNMKGVVDSMEFFQRDNYLVLVSVRRALVKDLEALYGASAATTNSSLKQSLKRVGPQQSPVFGAASVAPLEVVLESAVLSLGRCLDLVRPAGQLKGAVSKQDWIKAVKALEHAMKQIRQVCDPDGPLNPTEWGRFSRSDNHEDDHSPDGNNIDALDSSDHDNLFEKSSAYESMRVKLTEDDTAEEEN